MFIVKELDPIDIVESEADQFRYCFGYIHVDEDASISGVSFLLGNIIDFNKGAMGVANALQG